MGISNLLRNDGIALPLEARDKWEAIRMLSQRLQEGLAIPAGQLEPIHQAVVAREKELSTGMERGIAIPHASVDGIGEAAAALGLAPQGIPFETLDGAPARIIVLLVTPRAQKLKHLRTLSTIVRVLSQEEVRSRLLAATDPEAVRALLEEREGQLDRQGEAWSGRPLSSS